ncbi:uncharacterized protein LOC124950645 [Vespa velutina]|uniref:uncharacterized protein LOC124950645 n=1 Tax=Vespa velutina TaxID=202808 RepID=UPI001FB40870|nr:uncharacterized protein LOC124950645 [Vespa velutina]
MANVTGCKTSKHRLLMIAVQSVFFNCAEVWADSFNKKSYQERLAQVQRRAAVRIASAYRTVTKSGILVIAGVIPTVLLMKERKTLHHRKSGWKGGNKQREDRKDLSVLADVLGTGVERTLDCEIDQRREERRHGETNYYLTQFLRGHGYF